ncbi:DUF2283 domain-containing protein [Candidatus Poribacteria bacterium]|nr:DUF2283 domain-containing protein [Candidatus Poribacteria bacterium]
MGTKTLKYHYDEEMDILAVWIRQPAEVVCVEPEDGIVLRIDANTDEFVGYTILDFRKRFAKREIELRELKKITLPLVPKYALTPIYTALDSISPKA